MEQRKTELEFDEFEKLLGEIPNATSGNSHCEESGPKRGSLDNSLLPICVNSYRDPLTKKLQNNRNFDDRKLLASKTQQSPVRMAQTEGANLPVDQSLTSGFAGLNFNDGMGIDPVTAPFANCKSSPNHSSLLDCLNENSLKNPSSNMDSQMMVVSAFNNMPCYVDKLDMTKVGEEDSNFLKLDAQGLKKLQVSYCQQVHDFSAAMPVHGLQGFPFLSNMPVPGVDFAVMSDQQQYFTDAQSPFPYLHSQQLNQPHLSWRNIEEEQYYRMNQQLLYLQQLRNQRLEAHHPIHANAHLSNRLTSRNLTQHYFEVPISHKLEQSSGEPFWNTNSVTRGLNLSNPAFSASDHNAAHVLAKIGKPKFPEKILTRSHGLNTLKAVKFGSVGGKESHSHVNQNGKVLSDSCHLHSFSSLDTCFQQDTFSSWDLSPDSINLRNTNLRPQPQKYNSLDEVSGRIYLMAKDQHGCRFLQRKFSEGNPEDIEKIFLEIIDHIVELMTDSFGNYLVQKLLEVCNEDQRMQILHAITRKAGDLVRISCDMHGTRAVQKVIETLSTPQQFFMVVSSLRPGIVTLIKNMNGNHVAQRCLQYLMPEHREFLFEAAITNSVELATDRHGCCVLQKCLSHSEGEERRRLVCEITSNALILSQDQFGNYVVQFVLELQFPWATMDILDQLEGNYGDLSMQKYSSNVVEKCLAYAGEERRACIIRELINNPRLDQIMQDPYGNYVIQAALQQSKGSLHAALVDAIRPHVPILRTSPYGKKVLSNNSLKK